MKKRIALTVALAAGLATITAPQAMAAPEQPVMEFVTGSLRGVTAFQDAGATAGNPLMEGLGTLGLTSIALLALPFLQAG